MEKGKIFGNDRDFLKEHVTVLELGRDSSKILISPQLQGRIMTSTAEGDQGYSYGWINYDLIRSRRFLPHCNNFGGEDRYWLGPEGGQYSIFFKKGTEFNLDNWQTPAPIDTESWELVSSSPYNAILQKNMVLENYQGRTLRLKAEREVLLHKNNEVGDLVGFDIPDDVNKVAFTSVNKLTNKGVFEWTGETGMLSIWILAQLSPSERTTVILPVRNNKKGKVVNDNYFGKIPDDRIKLLPSAVLFKGDGKKRGKIGVGPKHVKPIIGSYDPLNGILTLVKFTFDNNQKSYINSMWEWQEEPFMGDVVNSYNDGPLPDGTIMGPFYELETSSAAANLKPGEAMIHDHTTMHLKGNYEALNKIAIKVLGTDLSQCF